jgi:hypothetical protein
MKKAFVILAALIAVAILFCRHFRAEPTAEFESAVTPPAEVKPTPGNDPAIPPQPVGVLPPPSAAEIIPADSKVLRRVAGGDTNVYKLSAEQIQSFLARNKTNADSLLAAFNVAADPEYLREAALRYPSNAWVVASVLGNDLFPAERREWIDRFKQVAGENPLPNYLSARDYLQNQQPQQALQELADASAKRGFDDYTVYRAQGLEELYLSSGYSTAEAKALATMSVQEPALPALRNLANDLSTMERQYATAGDSASVAAIAKVGLGLAADITSAGARTLGTQMLGASAERDFLTGLDPNGSYDFLQQPIAERLAQLRADRNVVLEESKLANNWLATADEPQLVSYFDRMKLYGEAAALQWARTQMDGTPKP